MTNIRKTSTSVRRTVAVGAALIVAVGALAACGESESSSGSGPIKIGVLAPMSGSVAADGQDMVRATELLIDQINDDGGIDGREIQVEVADDACEAQQGTQAAQKLATAKVVAVVGGFCSSASLPAQEVFKRSGYIPFAMSVSSNPQLTNAENTNVTRFIGRDDQEAPVEVEYLAGQLNSTKLAIMNDDTEFSRSTSGLVKDGIVDNGGVEIVYDDSITPGQNDYRTALDRVARSGADTLIYTGFHPEFGIIAQQWEQGGFDYNLVGGASTSNASVAETAPNAARSPKFTIIAYPTLAQLTNPEAAAFRDAFEAKYGEEPGAFGIFQYDATTGLVEALKATIDDLSAESLGEALRNLNFDGITGPISFDEKGDRVSPPFQALRAGADGKFASFAFYSNEEGWVVTQ